MRESVEEMSGLGMDRDANPHGEIGDDDANIGLSGHESSQGDISKKYTNYNYSKVESLN